MDSKLNEVRMADVTMLNWTKSKITNNLRVRDKTQNRQERLGTADEEKKRTRKRMAERRTVASGRGVTERLWALCINDRLQRARRDCDRPTVNLTRSESIEKRSNSDDRYLASIASDGEVDWPVNLWDISATRRSLPSTPDSGTAATQAFTAHGSTTAHGLAKFQIIVSFRNNFMWLFVGTLPR